MSTSVAVIIPTYNRAHCLARALDSALAQTRPAEEIWVVDDGSEDATAQLVEDYPGVHYLQQANRGVSAARNLGIQHSQGDWLAFLDSDDAWLPRKLEKQLAAWQEQPQHRLIHCDEIWVRNGVRVNPMRKHEKAGGMIFERCLPLCAISPSASLIQRSLLEEVGGFDESLPACEDYDLWLRVCAQHPVLYLDEALLTKYGGHPDQLSRQHWGMDRFRIAALAKLLDSSDLRPGQRQAVRAMLLEKCHIMRDGAAKRANAEVETRYQQLIDRFGDETEAAS